MILINNKLLFEELFKDVEGQTKEGQPKAVVKLYLDKFEYETNKTFTFREFSLYIPIISIIKERDKTTVEFNFPKENEDIFNKVKDMISFYSMKSSYKDLNHFYTITLYLFPIERDDYFLFFTFPINWNVDEKDQKINITYPNEHIQLIDENEEFEISLQDALNS